MSASHDDPTPRPERMHCMEVWGGNEAADNSFAMPGLDVCVWSRPQGNSGIDGGDVHFLSSCASGRITRMLLADVCGHGPVFLQLASELRDLMMNNVNSVKQARFLRQMHQRLRCISDRGGFATALVSTFFAVTRTIALCNAGHPSPLIYRSQSREWSVLRQVPATRLATERSPAGVLEQHEYQQFTTRLEDGDTVLSYSNVLTECRDAGGQILGVQGLRRLVGELDQTLPAGIVSQLVERLCTAHPRNLEDSDATVLVCRATERHVGWRDNLLAPFRLLTSVVDNTRLR